MRTFQLRRYDIAEGKMPEFTAWLDQTLIPVRKQFGFQIEFRLIETKANRFIWCVSLPGDEAEFLKVQDAYAASAERAAAFESFPDCIESSEIGFVEALDLPK